MKNKRGGAIGSTIVAIPSMFVIAIILISSIAVVGLVKKFNEEPAGDLSFEESEDGQSFFEYIDKENKIVSDIEYFVAGGGRVDDSLEVSDGR